MSQDQDRDGRRTDPASWLATAAADDVAEFIAIEEAHLGLDLNLMEKILVNAFRRIARLERATGLDQVELPGEPEGGDR